MTIRKPLLISLFLTISTQFPSAWAKPDVALTILHTNDLHSHFRGQTYPFPIGGVARLKTAIQNLRKTLPYTSVVDGGDWSEGSIYYTEGAGAESVHFFDELDYDFAVVGNHDWLNGPEYLIKALKMVRPKTKFLSANMVADDYSKRSEFEANILPYVIRDYGGHKVAWIGLSTYEFVYDKYVAPVKITEPFFLAGKLARELKAHHGVTGVVIISHNSITANRLILQAAPDVDLIVGAHDHKKLTHPEVVTRIGAKPGWIVEAGKWGEYLGRVDVTLSDGEMKLKHYQLLQMDSSVPEDPGILAELDALEARIESKQGPIFHDQIGQSEIEIANTGVENPMANFVADSYQRATHADFAMESNKFIYSSIHPGPIRTVDAFNYASAVFNPVSGKTWTLRTIPIKGRALKWFLYFLFGTQKLSSFGLASFSGLTLKYDPLFASQQEYDPEAPNNLADEISSPGGSGFIGIESIPVVQEIQIQGKPLDSSAYYTMATGGGILESIEFVNSKIWNVIPMDEVRDTGKENWRVLADHIREFGVLNSDGVSLGDRIHTLQQDLGIYYSDVSWIPLSKTATSYLARVRAKIRNYGATPSNPGNRSRGPGVRLVRNTNGQNLAIDPIDEVIGEIKPIRQLNPNESLTVEWTTEIPEVAGLYPVTVQLTDLDLEVNLSDKEVTVWLDPARTALPSASLD